MAGPGRPRKQQNLEETIPESIVETVVEADYPDEEIVSESIDDSARESVIKEVIDPIYIPPYIEEALPSDNLEIDLDGWMPIGTATRNGMAIRVSENASGEGILVFWKKTRAFANATKRWEITGKWFNHLTGLPISFTPKYWKERF